MSTETTTIPLDRPFTATTVEEVEELLEQVSTIVVRADWTPTTMWCDEAGDWHGIRPVDEDDGAWADVPPESRQTLAFPALPFDPDDSESIERALPVYVLWHDAMLMPAPAAADQTRPTDDQSGSRAPVQGVTAAVQRATEALIDRSDAYDPDEAIARAALAAALSDVEGIARAMYEASTAFVLTGCKPWQLLGDSSRARFMDQARAVVAHLLGGEVG